MRRALSLLCISLALVGCNSGTVKTGVTGTDLVTRTMPGQQVVDTKHGKEVWLGTGPISGVGEVNANGVAVGHVFEDGASTYTVNANMYPAPAGQQYVAWLISPDGKEQVNMGYLSSPTNDARHSLTFMTGRDLRAFIRVEITQEARGSTVRSGKLQAEGTLKERSR